MSRYSNKQAVSPETQNDAMKLARGIQRPGQTKEQTKLIAQGIQKGIEQYKKQHKAKSRELDKRLKSIQIKAQPTGKVDIQERVVYRLSWLPWSLLVLSWTAAGFYFFLG